MGASKKVLILCRESAHMGGVVNYIDSVTKHYRRDSFVVELFIIGRRSGSESDVLYILDCCFDLVRFFVKLFNKDYKLIHLNPSLGTVPVLRDCFFLIVAKIHRCKVLVFWHGWRNDFQSKLDSNKSLLKLFKLTYGNADATVVLASSFKEKLKEWKFTKKIIVETTTFDESLIDGFNPEQKINEIKGSGKLTILFLSRLEVAKGIVETIEAFAYLQDIDREMELVIAGDGPAFGLVKELVKKSGDKRISMIGYVKDLAKRAILERSHLMLLPSYGEGLPVCMLESMAFGIPIITTPVGGIPDNFIEGENGYYIHNVNGKSLAELIKRTIADKDALAGIVANNYSFARKKFPASIVAQRLDAIYQQVSEV